MTDTGLLAGIRERARQRKERDKDFDKAMELVDLANAQRDHAYKARDFILAKNGALEKERDEARAEAAKLKEILLLAQSAMSERREELSVYVTSTMFWDALEAYHETEDAL